MMSIGLDNRKARAKNWVRQIMLSVVDRYIRTEMAPDAKLAEPGAGTVTYDPAQRAFVVARPSEPANTPLTIQIDSSTERPLVNPAIVIERWDAPTKV